MAVHYNSVHYIGWETCNIDRNRRLELWETHNIILSPNLTKTSN